MHYFDIHILVYKPSTHEVNYRGRVPESVSGATIGRAGTRHIFTGKAITCIILVYIY